MAEFKVVLDGLELTDEQTQAVSRAVLKTAMETIGRLRETRDDDAFLVPVNGKLLGRGVINGGEILLGARALELQKHLFENGPLAGDLDAQFRV